MCLMMRGARHAFVHANPLQTFRWGMAMNFVNKRSIMVLKCQMKSSRFRLGELQFQKIMMAEFP
jgi:hypothetical protein